MGARDGRTGNARRGPVGGPTTADSSDIRPERCLIGSNHLERLGELAEELAAAGVAPVLAMSRAQLEHFAVAVHVDVVVVDETIDGGDELRTEVPVLHLGGPPPVSADPMVLAAHLPASSPPDEVVARAIALHAVGAPGPELRVWGPLRLDLARGTSSWRGRVLHLTASQVEILAALIEAQGSVVSSAALQTRVWSQPLPDDDKRLYAHVRRIRQKIEPDPSRPRFLLTARGRGFRLADPDAGEGEGEPRADDDSAAAAG